MINLKNVFELKEGNKLNEFLENLYDENEKKYYEQKTSLLKEGRTEDGAKFLKSKNINPYNWDLADMLSEWREIFIEKEFQRTGLRC